MTDRLAATDKHHWAPIPSLLAWLADRLPPSLRVLDVGAGYQPFTRANVLADIVEPQGRRPDQEFVRCDVGAERLPFPDKHFDFVFCRHMLEDMADPFAAMREIERVGKTGYIETPSPLAELCRGVDGGAPAWRGYNHHRWIAWTHEGELRFVSKWPIIEYLATENLDLAELLRQGPRYWNTYHSWSETIRFVHRDNPTHFAMPHEYLPQLTEAVRQSKTASDAFWAHIPAAVMIPQIGLNRGVAA